MAEGRILRRELADASSRPREVARDLLRSLPAGIRVLATGYGRDLLEVEHGLPSITEIKAHAAGARFLAPGCTAVVDVGGQDVKVIRLDPAGRVQKFEMNDRCAAGTGKFLEIMAHRLGWSLDAFPAAARTGADGVAISSMCAVFAESEVIGLLNRGCRREDVARAVHTSIARRIAGMFSRAGGNARDEVLFTGGGAHNECLVAILADLLPCPCRNDDLARFAGAIGCALLGG